MAIKFEPQPSLVEELINAMGPRFSRGLGIDLEKRKKTELFKWLLASKLYGGRISSTIAERTYRAFSRHNVLTPEKILETGWDGLVKILDEGAYVRYDFSTATRLLEISNGLLAKFRGDLNRLHERAKDEKELEELLKGLGKGIGDITANIFLRELRGIWPKARPEPSALVKLAAEHLGILKPGQDPLTTLEKVWRKDRVSGMDFPDFEAALLKLGKGFCRKGRFDRCPFGRICGRLAKK